MVTSSFNVYNSSHSVAASHEGQLVSHARLPEGRQLRRDVSKLSLLTSPTKELSGGLSLSLASSQHYIETPCSTCKNLLQKHMLYKNLRQVVQIPQSVRHTLLQWLCKLNHLVLRAHAPPFLLHTLQDRVLCFQKTRSFLACTCFCRQNLEKRFTLEELGCQYILNRWKV